MRNLLTQPFRDRTDANRDDESDSPVTPDTGELPDLPWLSRDGAVKTDAAPLFAVRNLTKHYPITKGVLKREVGRVRAVDGVTFGIERGETLGLVGESGCGKSTVATTALRLEEPTDGDVYFKGDDITGYSKADLKTFRREAQMLFQDPSSSFDPRMTIGSAVAEPLLIHGIRSSQRRREIVTNLLERVGLEADDYDRYPHEFSGGQKQRIALARALVVNPDLLVADEPVSALDVSIQSEILELVNELQAEFNLGILFISHDMSVIRDVCDRVAVMYLGEIVEVAPTDELFANPQHPYTQALLSSVPTPDPHDRGGGVELQGTVPSPSNPPSGCRFHTRCPKLIQPPDYDLDQDAWVGIMAFRHRLETNGIDVEAARQFVYDRDENDDSEEATSDEALAAVDTAAVIDALRDEFSIPEDVGDAAANDVVTTAFEQLVVEDDADAAVETLQDAFTTPCETDVPPVTTHSEDGVHRAACHLLDD